MLYIVWVVFNLEFLAMLEWFALFMTVYCYVCVSYMVEFSGIWSNFQMVVISKERILYLTTGW
jgi:hypothetical protein